MARFYYLFGDEVGHVSVLEYADVEYNSGITPTSEIEVDENVAEGCAKLKWQITAGQAFDYNVYYSENNQPFVLWLPNTTATTATFKGQAGTSYRFTVTARDKFNNSESLNKDKYVKVTF